MAASITARLTKSVVESFTREIDKVFYCSDSSTVLSWLKRENGNWRTYVFNRVREIKTLSDINDWRFIPGEFNPADLPSRGCSPSQLVHSKWWLGLGWLKKIETDWPSAVESVDKFWIISLRQITRSIITKCIVCQKQKVKRLECDSPPLPLNSVRDAEIFEATGVDFTGPVYIKGEGKRWICIFTCAVYRAVHLELASSLSVEWFILCLRRFIARRGRPEYIYIYSDNGTNFVGTTNALNGLEWVKIVKNTVF